MPSLDDNYSFPWMKMLLAVIVLTILVIVCVVIYRWMVKSDRNEPVLITKPTPSHNVSTITNASTKAPLSTIGQEYTYNFWMYIDNWANNFGQMKHVFTRSGTSPMSMDEMSGVANPTVWLYPEENNLAVRVSTLKMSNSMRQAYDANLYPDYDVVSCNAGEYTNVNPNYYHAKNRNDPQQAAKYVNTTVACDISNIPLQRWVMVSVVLWNRTLDVYINGLLTRSVVLPGAPLFDPSELGNIYCGGRSGSQTFSGFFSKFKYYNRAITAPEVMELYEKGPLTSNYWWNALKYNIKLTLDVDQEK
jgi:hypothetical protein